MYKFPSCVLYNFHSLYAFNKKFLPVRSLFACSNFRHETLIIFIYHGTLIIFIRPMTFGHLFMDTFIVLMFKLSSYISNNNIDEFYLRSSSICTSQGRLLRVHDINRVYMCVSIKLPTSAISASVLVGLPTSSCR